MTSKTLLDEILKLPPAERLRPRPLAQPQVKRKVVLRAEAFAHIAEAFS